MGRAVPAPGGRWGINEVLPRKGPGGAWLVFTTLFQGWHCSPSLPLEVPACLDLGEEAPGLWRGAGVWVLLPPHSSPGPIKQLVSGSRCPLPPVVTQAQEGEGTDGVERRGSLRVSRLRLSVPWGPGSACSGPCPAESPLHR